MTRVSLTGEPRKMQVAGKTPIVTVQSGSSYKIGSAPVPPVPIAGSELFERRRITEITPRTIGGFQQPAFGVTWQYVFED